MEHININYFYLFSKICYDIATYIECSCMFEGITTGEFPEYIESHDELEYLREQEVEAVVQTFGYEETDEDQETITQKRLTETSSRIEILQNGMCFKQIFEENL